MGGLLKEALKSLCGVTQWSYAVFWKICCHNTKLLIWEEYYYESAPSELQNPESPFIQPKGGCGSGYPSRFDRQPWDKVGLLINKMMNNRIVLVGQGLVGRAAFSGNHQWINANNYVIDAQPLEVQNEVHLQFSAGMQTIAVIPVFPHGVLQLGSYTTITENIRFVNDVKSLILCLGSIPGAVLSNSYGANECVDNIGIPFSLGNSVSMDSARIRQSVSGHSGINSMKPISDIVPGCQKVKDVTLSVPANRLTSTGMLSGCSIDNAACFETPSGDDLFDVLGADLKRKLLDRKRNDVLAEGPDSKVQSAFSDTFSVNKGMPELGVNSWVVMDHLLDAVVSSAQPAAKQTSDDDVSCRTTSTKFGNSFGRVGFSNRTSVYGSEISSLVESGHTSKHESSLSTAYSKKDDEMIKPNRKRLKPGENPRPRPKDRQMIQDRVKELREIVPNGAKCSIDALLEKTIKHMLFLQSVTKHADKLKLTGESKIKDNFKGGITWAFEVWSRSMICPIVVEDLNPPRQLLVEMLCEGRGFFLEIADLIRGMGLTILKGVMETRNDKVWARFAVEAIRDVTRVEIFMLLVHLLDQTMRGSASSANAFDSDNVTVQQSFHRAATGSAGSLR